MNKETFIYAIELVHDVLHKVHRPTDKAERIHLIGLIQGYLAIIANFDEDIYKTLYDFLVTHREFDRGEVALLYSYIANEPEILN